MAKDLLKQAFDLLREGRLHEAEAIARRIVEDRPGPDADVYYLMGCVLASRSDLDGAVRVLEQALGLPTEERARLFHQLKLAEVLREQGHLDRSEALLRDNLELRRKLYGPREVPVALTLRALAEVFWERGQILDAREQMEESFHILFSHGDAEAGRTMARLELLRSLSRDEGLLDRFDDLPDALQDDAVDELLRRIPRLASHAAERLLVALGRKVRRDEDRQRVESLRGEVAGFSVEQDRQTHSRQEELARLLKLGKLAEAMELEMELARVASWSGWAEEAERILRGALERCNEKGDARIQGRLGRALAQTLAEQRRIQEAFLAAEAALAAAERCRDNTEIGLAAAVLGRLYLTNASPGRARPLLTLAVVSLPADHPEWFGARESLRSLLKKGGGPSERPISERLRDAVFHKLPDDMLSSLFIDRHGRFRATFMRRPTPEELTLLRRILGEFGSDLSEELDKIGPPGLEGVDSPAILLRWN